MKKIYENDIMRCLLILAIGFASALFIYPLIHELGHVIASFCVGADVMEFTLFPLPSVLCDVGKIDNTSKVIIGFGGMVLPLIIAEIVPKKWFWTWYIRMLLKGISLLSFLISVVSVTANCNPQDDMVNVLKYWAADKSILLLLLCGAAGLIILSIVRERPIKKLCMYFGV